MKIDIEQLLDEQKRAKDERARSRRARKRERGEELTIDDFPDVSYDDLRDAGLL